MDSRQIQYFVALFEEKSITKAARRLHVVQPAVSMQIRRIEVDYGTPLFVRKPSGVYPNEKAEAIYPMCIEVLNTIEKMRRTLREGSGKISGALAVGVPPSIAHGVLADVLAGFQTKYPEVHLTISEGYSAHLVDWLLQGGLDFAVLGESEDDRRLYSETIVTEELRVLTSMDTDFAGDTIAGKDIQQFKLILPSAKNLIRILIDSEFEQAKIELKPSMEIDSLATVFAMVRRPGWATILPGSAIRGNEAQFGLRGIPLVEPVVRRTLVATFPVLKPASAAAQQFIKELQAAVRENRGKKAPHKSG